jgi:16S rRNA (uracil1498-N3)-methyltransferase
VVERRAHPRDRRLNARGSPADRPRIARGSLADRPRIARGSPADRSRIARGSPADRSRIARGSIDDGPVTCRVLVEPGRLRAGPLAVEGETYGYLFRVRRLAVGEPVVVFDGAGREARARVDDVGPTRATLLVGEPRAVAPARPRITVVQALIKGERMAWCLEKLVEAGVDVIVPCASARAVVRLDDDRRASRHQRNLAIVREAARQCQRADLPHVHEATTLAAALKGIDAARKLVAHPAGGAPLLAAVAGDPADVALLIGPEGGLDEAELTLARDAGFAPVSLGRTVLRAETAGPVAVAAIRLAAEARADAPTADAPTA